MNFRPNDSDNLSNPTFNNLIRNYDIELLKTSPLIDLIDQRIFCKYVYGQYIFCNNSFAQAAGLCNRDQIEGKSDNDLIWKSQLDQIKNFEKMLVDSQDPTIRQPEIQIREDGKTSVLMSRTKISQNGRPAILGNFTDLGSAVYLESQGYYNHKESKFILEFMPGSLTFHELRILYHILYGFTDSKISEKTGLSARTVHFHTDKIKEKIICMSKHEIIEKAINSGIYWSVLRDYPEALSKKTTGK